MSAKKYIPKKIIKITLFDLISLIITVVSSVLIGWFFLTLYNGFNFYVDDLGLNYHELFLFYHTHILAGWPYQIPRTPFNGSLIYAILSPLVFFYNSPATFVAFESVWISIGSYFLFRIAREETGSVSWAFVLQLIYLLFPSNYGMITNGPEFEIMLSTFLLMSYYFFKRGNFYTSAVIGILGATTSFVSPLIIALLFAIEDFRSQGYSHHLFRKIIRRKGEIQKNLIPSYKYSMLILVAGLVGVMVLVLVTTPVLSNLFNYYLNRTGTTQMTTSTGSFAYHFLSNFTMDGSVKLSYLYGTLSGFLFLPLISPYALLIIPFFIVIFYGNFLPYYDVLSHLNFLFSAFLFLGFVYNIRKIRWDKSGIRKVMIVLIVAMLLSFLLYSPFSVTNIQDGTLHSELNVTQVDNYLNTAFAGIPVNASVFSQMAFPQLTNRMFFYMPGSYDNQTVNYAVITPLPIASVPSHDYAGFSSFWAQHFLDNSSYGIYESISSVTIFKLNYHSGPIIFIPLVINYPINSSFKPGISYQQPVFAGNYEYLPPGEYQLTCTVKINGSSSSLTSAEIYETTSLSNGTIIPTSPSTISILQVGGNIVEYTTYQQFSSFAVEYRLALELTTLGKPLAVGITVVSLEMKLVSVQG